MTGNRCYSIPLKNIRGAATFTGKPSPELIEAVNQMAELAYKNLKKKTNGLPKKEK